MITENIEFTCGGIVINFPDVDEETLHDVLRIMDAKIVREMAASLGIILIKTDQAATSCLSALDEFVKEMEECKTPRERSQFIENKMHWKKPRWQR